MIDEIIPGLGAKIKKWNGDHVSKIKDIITYMNSFPKPMTEIGLAEAAQIGQTTEQNISAHLAGHTRFTKTGEKGMYRLLQKGKNEKIIIKPKLSDKKIDDEIKDPDYMNLNKEKPVMPKKTTKKDPFYIITRTTHYCPHCDGEILIPGV